MGTSKEFSNACCNVSGIEGVEPLALFPLHTVLYPGARLPLRIFERRYLDLISRCLRATAPFGVCLIQSGSEVGAAAECHLVGTAARIVDWDQLEGGLLGITVMGEWRFRAHARTVAPDNLLLGEVERLPEEPPGGSHSHAALAELLRRILDENALQYAAEIHRIHEADWLSYRLAELLAFPLPVKQQLLETGGHAERLAAIQSLLDRAGAAQSQEGRNNGH